LNRVASQVIIDDSYIRVDEEEERKRESTRFREARNDQSISPFRASPSRGFIGDRERQIGSRVNCANQRGSRARAEAC